MTRTKMTAVASAAIGLMGLAAMAETSVYYVPQGGSSPYGWSVVGNWFTDTAGTTPLGSVPGSTESVNLSSSALEDATVTIPAGSDVKVYDLNMGGYPMTLEVEGGSSLYLGHSSYMKGSDTTLHIKSGGSVTNNSNLQMGTVAGAYARLIIDEGGHFHQGNNNQSLLVSAHRNGKALVENHGTLTVANSFVRLGYSSSINASAISTGVLDNYGVVETDSHSSKYFTLGSYPYATGIVTNHEGATMNVSLPFTVGAMSNTTGRVCNYGTFNHKASRAFSVGGDLTESTGVTSASKASTGFVENYGTMSLSGITYIGCQKYCTGEFVNRSNAALTVNNKVVVGNKLSSTGRLTLEGSSTVTGVSKNLSLAGETPGATAEMTMSGDAFYSKVGTIFMATGAASRATLTLSDNATMTGVSAINIGCGNGSTANPPWARLELRDNAQITNFNGAIRIGANSYGRGELVLAGNARIIRKPGTLSTGLVHIGNASTNSYGMLRMRGGTLQMPYTNSTIVVGRSVTNYPCCNGFIQGWGTIDRLDKTVKNNNNYDTRLTLFNGAIVADGEGEMHDLDLSVVRRVAEDSPNTFGTNGWYAINKGRLVYPSRWTGYVCLGDYYAPDSDPKLVNSVLFDFTGKSGYLHGQLYALDRDDIPAGLPEDDVAKGVKRLGVWRAGLHDSYFYEKVIAGETTRGSFTSATAKIRYNNFLLNELKDANGEFRDGQRLHVYQYTGAGWKKVASAAAQTAEDEGHYVSGTLLPVDDDWNMGFFAVVAEPKKGTSIILR